MASHQGDTRKIPYHYQLYVFFLTILFGSDKGVNDKIKKCSSDTKSREARRKFWGTIHLPKILYFILIDKKSRKIVYLQNAINNILITKIDVSSLTDPCHKSSHALMDCSSTKVLQHTWRNISALTVLKQAVDSCAFTAIRTPLTFAKFTLVIKMAQTAHVSVNSHWTFSVYFPHRNALCCQVPHTPTHAYQNGDSSPMK